MSGASSLYLGKVMHRRLAPVRHRLAYDVFYLLIDLDELPDMGLRLLSRRKAALVSFRTEDHGDGGGRPLKDWANEELARAGLPKADKIRLLCMPRILGFVFNPLSIFFCYGPDETLRSVLLEVNNTFGERHVYALPAEAGGMVRQRFDKQFHVSPFMDMNMVYDLRLGAPAASLSVAIRQMDATRTIMTAALAAERRPLTDLSLARALLLQPFLTFKVIAGIHWEALLLWGKGIKIRQHPKHVREIAGTAKAGRA